MKECFDLLKRYKYKLTRQQILTLKGQIKKGDYIGFRKVINKLTKEINYAK